MASTDSSNSQSSIEILSSQSISTPSSIYPSDSIKFLLKNDNKNYKVIPLDYVQNRVIETKLNFSCFFGEFTCNKAYTFMTWRTNLGYDAIHYDLHNESSSNRKAIYHPARFPR
jgi:hypothetical protein